MRTDLDRIDGVHDGVFLQEDISYQPAGSAVAGTGCGKTNRDASKGAGRHVLRQRKVGREGFIAIGRVIIVSTGAFCSWGALSA